MKVKFNKDGKVIIEMNHDQLLTLRSVLFIGLWKIQTESSIAKQIKSKLTKSIQRDYKEAKKFVYDLEEATLKEAHRPQTKKDQ